VEEAPDIAQGSNRTAKVSGAICALCR